MAKIYNSILDLVGNTPIVRLPYFSDKYGCEVLAKLECFNPSLSIKDRIVKYIIEQAEKTAQLKPGMTLVDATSGNTGLAIAQIALAKGYKCILTVKDSSAKAKIDQLLAYGAEVILCPAVVKHDHPESYYSVAKRLSDQNSSYFYLNQNHNQQNAQAHYLTTGKEIYEQTNGLLTHVFSSASTTGTISGIANFLKSKNTDIQIICADAKGSVLKPYVETGQFNDQLKKQTKLEGVGKDIIPSIFKSDLIDHVYTIDDERSEQLLQELLKKEGVFCGGSSGAVLHALDQYASKLKTTDQVVLIFADHGLKYLNKHFSSTLQPKQASEV